MNFRFALLTISLFTFFSCAEKPLVDNDRSLISIEIDAAKTALLEDFILKESLDTIKLEENKESLLGAIDKIQRFNGRFYILDIRITNSVFIFSDEGKYLGKINTVGDGYGSYYLPFDMIVNPFSERLEIMDVRQRKILSYSLDGDFIEEWQIDEQLMDFAPLSSEKYVFHRDGREFEPGNKHPLITISNPTNTVSYLEGVLQYGITDYYHIINKFSHHNSDRLLYMHPMHDTIYEINPEFISQAYIVDFKEKKVPYKIKSHDMMGFHQEFSTKDYYMVNGNLLESSQLISFLWLRKERGWENMGEDFDAETFLTLFDKTTGHTINIPISSEDARRGANFPILADEDFFYAVHYPSVSSANLQTEPNAAIVKFRLKSF